MAKVSEILRFTSTRPDMTVIPQDLNHPKFLALIAQLKEEIQGVLDRDDRDTSVLPSLVAALQFGFVTERDEIGALAGQCLETRILPYINHERDSQGDLKANLETLLRLTQADIATQSTLALAHEHIAEAAELAASATKKRKAERLAGAADGDLQEPLAKSPKKSLIALRPRSGDPWLHRRSV